MFKSALAGIDIGTSKIRCVLYNTKGISLLNNSFKTPLIKKDGEYYNPTEGIYEILIKLLNKTFKFSKKNNYCIKGICISSVGEAGVPIDKNLNSLMDIIPWYDQRTEIIRNKLIKNKEDYIYKNTGLNSDHFYSVYKILWIKKNNPKIYSKIYKWLPVNDYYAMRLTNNISTDYSQAMRTLLFNPKKLNWSKEMIKLFKINRNILPKIINAGEVKGVLNIKNNKFMNLNSDCIVSAGGHDHFVGIYGIGGFREGTAVNSMGSAEALAVNTKKYLINKKLKNGKFISGIFKTKSKNNFYVVGSILTSGTIIEWFKRVFNIKSYVDLDKILRSSKDKNIIFFPQFEFSHSPINLYKTKGFVTGIDRATTIGDLYSALLKCLTFDTKNALEFISKETKININKLICSGGSVQNKEWMKIRANILNHNLLIDKNVENVSLGSAILAGIASKVYKNDNDAFKKIKNKFEKIDTKKMSSHDNDLIKKYNSSIKKITRLNILI